MAGRKRLCVLSLVPNNPDAHNNLGTALAAKGDLEEAAARYRHALALKPALVEGYANLASVLLAAGDAGAAVGVVARGLSIRETPIFVQCVRAMRSFPQGKEFRDLVMRALAEAWGRPGDLAPCALALVKQNSVLHACVDRATAAGFPFLVFSRVTEPPAPLYSRPRGAEPKARIRHDTVEPASDHDVARVR